MPLVVSPTDSDIFAALRAVLIGMLPAGTEVVLGQINRVPEPKAGDFVVFWPTRRERIETNIDGFDDVVFTASIAGAVLSVSSVQVGEIVAGAQLFGTGLASGTTTITGTAGGTGGTGDYAVTPTQIAAEQTMAAGGKSVLQPTMLTVQIDCHGPNSGNNAQVISTLFRDAYAVDAFAQINPAVVPLYADDPRQAPFLDEQQQFEYRWVVEALLQANQLVTGIPQQFADTVDVELISVDAAFPA